MELNPIHPKHRVPFIISTTLAEFLDSIGPANERQARRIVRQWRDKFDGDVCYSLMVLEDDSRSPVLLEQSSSRNELCL